MSRTRGLCLAMLLSACGSSTSGSDPSSIREFVPDGDARYGEPRFSPDGTQLAAIRSRGADDVDELVIIDLASGKPTVLAQAGTYLASPAWTPDGTAILVTAADGVLRAASDGSGTTSVLSGFQAFAAMKPDVSPDGQRLIFRVNGGTIKIANLTTSTVDDTKIFGDSPRFAPDGSRFAYLDSKGVTVEADAVQSFPAEVALLPALAWFPDGARIAYTSSEGISILDLGTGKSTLHHDSFATISLDVSRDGSSMVYAVNGQAGLFLIDAP